MKVVRLSFQGLPWLLALTGTVSVAGACTPTGFVRDSMNLTAAVIDPSGILSGDVDGTGCNIGVYYDSAANGQVNGASVHGANYYGIVNNGGNVQVENSTVYDIGDTPLDGDQHGVAIYWVFGADARGNITGNVIWNYQKGGIVVNGPSATSNVTNNTVIGQGPVNYIAQNGIQFGYGSQGSAKNNIVVGNSYTGPGETASGGIILVGGAGYAGAPETGITVSQNVLVGNDIGVWFSNLDGSGNPVATPTNDVAANNTVRNNAVNNTTGNGTAGYQAGIADQGDGDTIRANSICGAGYTPVTPPPFLYTIDTTVTNNVTVKNNTACDADGPVTSLPPTVHHGKIILHPQP